MRANLGRTAALLSDPDGRLLGASAPGVYSAPTKVELDSKASRLLYDMLDREVKPTLQLLPKFVQLAEADDRQILDFARRWGVLGICEHDMPKSHHPRDQSLIGFQDGCLPLGFGDATSKHWWFAWDPLKSWRIFSAQARALLDIAERLHGEDVGRPADWRVLYAMSGRADAPWWKQSLAVERLHLMAFVNAWLVIGNVRHMAGWHGRDPSIVVGVGGLFGALATQLLFATTQTRGWTACSHCGLPYVPLRRPRPNGRHYCPDCQKSGAAARDASRDYYGRTRRNIKEKTK